MALANGGSSVTAVTDTIKPPALPPPGLPLSFPQRRQRCISCSEAGSFNTSIDDGSSSDGGTSSVKGQQQQLLPDVPDVIVTRRTRTDSVCGKIFEDVEMATVKYFCRSRGHGFVKPDKVRSHAVKRLPRKREVVGLHPGCEPAL